MFETDCTRGRTVLDISDSRVRSHRPSFSFPIISFQIATARDSTYDKVYNFSQEFYLSLFLTFETDCTRGRTVLDISDSRVRSHRLTVELKFGRPPRHRNSAN